MNDRERLTIDQAAARVGVSRRTIYNWVSGRKVETIRTAGGSLRIFADTLYRTDRPPDPSPAPE